MNNANLGPTTGRAGERHLRNLFQLFELLSERAAYIPWELRSILMPREDSENFALAISNLARQLSQLERYERRALSRRKKAFRRFDTEQRKTRLAENRDVTPGDIITVVEGAW